MNLARTYWTNSFCPFNRVKHQKVKYEEMDRPGVPKSHVLFRSTFINDTNKEQEYQLAAERKTMSTCSFELFEGFVNEGQAELSISVPIPGCALEVGAGFRHEYVLENTSSKTVQEEMNWSLQSNIKVSRFFQLWTNYGHITGYKLFIFIELAFCKLFELFFETF